jgi:hypothetical protein
MSTMPSQTDSCQRSGELNWCDIEFGAHRVSVELMLEGCDMLFVLQRPEQLRIGHLRDDACETSATSAYPSPTAAPHDPGAPELDQFGIMAAYQSNCHSVHRYSGSAVAAASRPASAPGVSRAARSRDHRSYGGEARPRRCLPAPQPAPAASVQFRRSGGSDSWLRQAELEGVCGQRAETNRLRIRFAGRLQPSENRRAEFHQIDPVLHQYMRRNAIPFVEQPQE